MVNCTSVLQIVLGWYRISQNVARMVGPFVGYLFLGLPNVSEPHTPKPAGKSEPGLAVAAVLAALLVALLHPPPIACRAVPGT